MEVSTLKALVSLLDDPDEAIYHQVKETLSAEGRSAIPLLEEAWENKDLGDLFRSRLEELVHEIQYKAVKTELSDWINSSQKDLFEGALIIARYHYPELKEEDLRNELKKIKNAIWLEINEFQTAYEKIRIFNKIFFGKLGFRGAGSDYYSPFNSYINCVLESKKGNPLSLSLIYSIVAQELQIPVYGVNLPNHFIMAYLDSNDILNIFSENDNNGILFYINTYAKGAIFDRSEIDAYLKSIDKEPSREYYEPCSNTAIIQRMLTNLVISYEQEGKTDKADELRELRQLFDLKF